MNDITKSVVLVIYCFFSIILIVLILLIISMVHIIDDFPTLLCQNNRTLLIPKEDPDYPGFDFLQLVPYNTISRNDF